MKRRTVLMAIVAVGAVACTRTRATEPSEATTSASAGAGGQSESASSGSDTTAAGVDVAITDVRLFDGSRTIDGATALIGDGMIAAVGTDVAVPDEAIEIDGAGRTLLPGLIDAHTHSFGRDALRRALAFGVTTHLDMFTVETIASQMRAEQAAGDAHDRADLLSSGYLATAPGGHGTQFGLEIPTLGRPEDAAPWVADRVAEGADYIKIVIEEGFGEELTFPTLDAATVEAVADAAHAEGLMAVTHVTSRDGARAAITAGSDALMHMAHDGPVDDDLVQLAVDAGIFVVPTLAVFEHITEDDPPQRTIADDPQLRPFILPIEERSLAEPYTGFLALDVGAAMDGVAALHEAGVPILAGSDAANPGTAYGATLHRELELLTEAGLSPVEALAAATSVPADRFGLDDRGRIAEGLRADLLLVEGDPTTDILATRAIVGVWKGGVRANRPKVRGG